VFFVVAWDKVRYRLGSRPKGLTSPLFSSMEELQRRISTGARNQGAFSRILF
jgi:hypothetical protein